MNEADALGPQNQGPPRELHRCGDIGLALHYLAEGLVDPTGLIEATLPFERVVEAFGLAARRGARRYSLGYRDGSAAR